MTYGELRDFLRNQLLADSDSGYYEDNELLDFLRISARELAALIGYPTEVVEKRLEANVGRVVLDTAVLRLVPRSVSFEGLSLMPGEYSQVMQYQSYQGLGQPRYYYFERTDPSRRLEIGPSPRQAGMLRLQVVKGYTGGNDLNAEVWGGVWSPYHRLVAYRGARMAFESAPGEEQRAQMMGQREQEMMQEFLLQTGTPNMMELSKAGGQTAGGGQ